MSRSPKFHDRGQMPSMLNHDFGWDFADTYGVKFMMLAWNYFDTDYGPQPELNKNLMSYGCWCQMQGTRTTSSPWGFIPGKINGFNCSEIPRAPTSPTGDFSYIFVLFKIKDSDSKSEMILLCTARIIL